MIKRMRKGYYLALSGYEVLNTPRNPIDRLWAWYCNRVAARVLAERGA
jgi:hypothetical protein